MIPKQQKAFRPIYRNFRCDFVRYKRKHNPRNLRYNIIICFINIFDAC